MRQFALAFILGLLSLTSASAQEVVPEKRFVVTRDTDFSGSDLQSLFDTTLDSCQRACLNNAECRAFTFNSRNNSCFPKSGITDRTPYEGAVSGLLVEVEAAVLDRARARFGDLTFLTPSDFARARNEAEALGVRHGGGQWTVEALLDAANEARGRDDLRDAVFWTGAALAQSDEAALWLQYAELSLAYANRLNGGDQRRFRNRALFATINAYVRAENPAQQITALTDLAQRLEADGRGRLMIPALRKAETLGARADVTELLDEAIGKYGFRVVDNQVESDSATPRICAEFNEPLMRAGVDYSTYVRLPDERLAVTSDDSRICISGVEHGSRYTVTFRAGLPAESGETLVRDIPVTAYVRDRAPSLSFPGRAYVLPKSADAGLPIETVNLDAVDLTLRRVSDRNLIRAIQNDYFGRPLGRYDADYFASNLAEEIWTGSGTVQNRLNANMTTRLPMGDVVGDLPAGVYALSAEVPGDDDTASATQWFLLSDIGMTTMRAPTG